MPQIIIRDKELIRISPQNAAILEYSANCGTTWLTRYSSSECGDFHSLTYNGYEIRAQTSRGFFYSNNGGFRWTEGFSWHKVRENIRKSENKNKNKSKNGNGYRNSQARGLLFNILIWLLTHPLPGWIILAILIIGIRSFILNPQ